MKNLILISFSFLMLLSCAKENPNSDPTGNTSNSSQNNTQEVKEFKPDLSQVPDGLKELVKKAAGMGYAPTSIRKILTPAIGTSVVL